MIYRWVVVFSIVFFLNKVFEPYGLKILGQIDGSVGLRRPGRRSRCTELIKFF